MAHKHLHELLREDQEPFQLKNYIADRRCQLKPTLQLKKGKPVVETSTRRILCNHACLFSSLHHSPDVRKSPFLDFPSPAKSPCNKKSPNTVFLHIPAKTAAMLLDAAIRIQKQASVKPKSDAKNLGFGLLGSILKRLKDRSNRSKSREIVLEPENPTIKSRKTSVVALDDKSVYEMGVSSCSCKNSRLSSDDWSDRSNEAKSLDLDLDLDTSTCSSRSEESADVQFVSIERESADFAACDEKCFRSSPSSHFRFSLQKSPSPGRRTPNFLSPVTSPSRHFNKEKESYEGEGLQKVLVEEEEEKEQCSPVSVLDTPFEDDDEEGHEDDGYDLEYSYASVQRAKHQLLQKLRRFERLAELDPIELEKRMLEQRDNEDEDEDLVEEEEEDECDEFDSLFLCEENLNESVREVFSKSGIHLSGKIPAHMKGLVSDLISEENKNEEDEEVVVKRVCKRLDSWKVVDSNTIDMMVELDFRREVDGWKRYDQEKIKETGMDIEVAILGLLVEELAEELLSLSGH